MTKEKKAILVFTILLLVGLMMPVVGQTHSMAVQNGFVTKSSKTYYYQNGKKVKGLQWIDGARYHFSSKGVMTKKAFKTVKSQKYYFGKNGKAYIGLKKVGKYLYYFDENGVMQKGWQTIDDKTYYFQSNGRAVKNKIKKIGDIYANFDVNGVYQITASYYMSGFKRMQVQYITDPVVSDEVLLAAIMYAESGGETQYPVKAIYNGKQKTLYQGQLAVGYTILNRLAHKSYPGSLKDVIYQQYQFEPARTGVLTELLNNPSKVSTACKTAAKVILNDYNRGTESIKDYKRSEFGWYNFWALAYARTRSDFFTVYSQKEYQVIGNQVFFNYTKTIHNF